VITTLDLTGLVRPHLVEMTKREDNPNSAEFRLQPLERGYGYTLGNSLRRLLLSSLRGAAVWAFRIDGVVHEHQTISGVVEDVHQIIQRLKQLTLVLVKAALEQASRGQPVSWIQVDSDKALGRMTERPTRDAIPIAAQEQLIVELYSK